MNKNKVKAKGKAKVNQEQKELSKIMDAIKICAVIQEMSEEDDDWYFFHRFNKLQPTHPIGANLLLKLFKK